MEKVVGFKTFNKGLITRQGDKLEDTLRYFDCNNIEICKAKGYPQILKNHDEYNGT